MPPAMSKSKEILKAKMIKTLRITSVIVTVLAVVFFVFPAVFGVRSDEQVEEFLKSPGVIEKFAKAKGDKAERSESQISPLVKEAQAFALYLNPPPKPVAKKSAAPRKVTVRPKPKPQAPVSPKFKLIAISYCASRPELSLVLIDEPGAGFRWVRQSGEVGHLIIEQVKDDRVIVKGSKGTFELVPEGPEEKNLIQVSSLSKRVPKFTPVFTGAGAGVESDKAPRQLSAKKEITPLKKTGVESDKAPGKLSAEEEIASFKKAIDELRAMKAEVGATETSSGYDSKETKALIEEMLSDMEAEAMRISAEEAEKLGDLGKELKAVQQDPNRTEGRGVKMPAEPEPREPNSPEKK